MSWYLASTTWISQIEHLKVNFDSSLGKNELGGPLEVPLPLHFLCSSLWGTVVSGKLCISEVVVGTNAWTFLILGIIVVHPENRCGNHKLYALPVASWFLLLIDNS